MQKEERTIPQLVEEVRAGITPRRRFIKLLTAMGISAAGVQVIAAAATKPSLATPIRHVNAQEEAGQHLQLHDQHITHQTQGNVGALHKDYAEHAVVEDSMYAEPFVGRAAIMARKNVTIAAASDAKLQVTNRVAHGNQVTVEWVATGTHTGDLPGLPASGRPFTLRGVTVVIRHDGKVVREALYYDVADLRRQLS